MYIVNGNMVNLSLWDTAGGSDYTRLRALSYPDTHVIVLTFSILSSSKFINLKLLWIPEIRNQLPNCPIILVGSDSDYNSAEDDRKVSEEEILQLCDEFNLKSYHLVSLLPWHGLRDLFDDIIFTGIASSTGEIHEPLIPRHSDKKCAIM